MKKYITISFSIFLLLSTIVSSLYAQSYYYYSHGKKIPLKISDEEITVKFSNILSAEQIQNLILSESSLEKSFHFRSRATKDFYLLKIKKNNDINQVKDRLEKRRDIDIVNPVFLLNEKTKLQVTDRFVVKFIPSVSQSEIDALNEQHHVEIVKVKSFTPNSFTLKITNASDLSLLDMVNLYHDYPGVVYSVPDFVGGLNRHSIPNDSYFSKQYYLRNTGQTGGVSGADINVAPAWGISTGSSSITVAVIDDGGSVNEDLPSNRIVAGYDFDDDDSDPTPDGNEGHGMACAGVIGATQNNNAGISGVSPNVKITFLKVFGHLSYASDDEFADAIDSAWQNGADIISNSWGGGEWYEPIEDAINNALTYGRDGKGSVVVFSAGNNADRPNNYGEITFPANVSGVIAVGATDKSNSIQSYSPRGTGTQLSVVAPSGGLTLGYGWITCYQNGQYDDHKKYKLLGDVWSTDIAGEPGDNPGDYGICPPTNYIEYTWDTPSGGAPNNSYTAWFGGTSAACPQVSGVAALILSVNPDLTQSQVKTIIQNSATDMGSSGYDTDFGYGRLNAYNALKYTLENYGGTLSGEVSLYDDFTFDENIIIASGANVTIQPGAILSFNNGVSLSVNGSLNAVGTYGSHITFDKSSAQQWEGINFVSGSTGQLQYCIIENANTGVTCTNSRPLIRYCEFNNNYFHIKGYYNYGSKQIVRDNEFFSSDDAGIYLYNCNVDCHGNELDGDDEDTDGIRVLYNTSVSNTLIYDNSIFDGTNGIRLDHGTARIQDNNIYGNSDGIYATDYASPRLLDYDETGLNVIANNNIGIYISSTSEADLDYAWNTVAGNSSKNLANYNSSETVPARDNYWGADPPPTGKFYGNINYTPWSDEDNTGRYPTGFMKVSPEENSIASENNINNSDDIVLSGKYTQALSLEHNGSFAEASTLFNEIIDLNPDHKLAVSALNHLIRCLDRIDKGSSNSKIQQIIGKHSGKEVERWALKYSVGNLIESTRYSEAVTLCKRITEKFPESGINSLYEEWIINNYILNDDKESNTIIEKYEKKYGLDEYLIEMKLEAGLIDAETAKSLKAQYYPKQGRLEEQTDINTIPKSYSLFPNYPNPFNPTTNIRYSLPYSSSVELRIYNINGREIKSFNISSQSAGYQNIVWDGTNENGRTVSSGVYLYKISIKSLESSETFVKTAKLMMLK